MSNLKTKNIKSDYYLEMVGRIMEHYSNQDRFDLEEALHHRILNLPEEDINNIYNDIFNSYQPYQEDDYDVTYAEEYKTVMYTVFLNGEEYRVVHCQEYDDYYGAPEWLVTGPGGAKVDSEIESKITAFLKVYSNPTL